jgi:DNA polymerase-3 subunit delta'
MSAEPHMIAPLIGHEKVLDQFRARIASGRMASTFLLLGPAGIGKRTFAMHLAATLLCPRHDSRALKPCGQCESCQLFAAGNHPDFDLVELPEGKRTLPLELFLGDREHRNREGLCHNIALRPLLGARRVAVIDDADWLSTESANCLLKTLEEPPPAAVILLLGTSRSRQLPTILSRAQLVQLEPLTGPQVAQLLLTQGIVADPEVATRLAAESHGSLSEARDALDEPLHQLVGDLSAQLRRGSLDVPRLAREITELANSAGTVAQARRVRLRQLVRRTSEAVRGMLRECCDAGADPELVIEVLDRCLEVEEHIDRNANQNVMVECWLDDLAGILRRGPCVPAVNA